MTAVLISCGLLIIAAWLLLVVAPGVAHTVRRWRR